MKTALPEIMKKNSRRKGTKELRAMKYKKPLFILLLFLVSSCLISCREKENEKIEITFIHGWGNVEKDHEAMRNIYKDFEKKYPQIKLNSISMPSAKDVISKVGDLLTVGEIPDVIFTAGDGRESIYEFMVEKNYALDLMGEIEKNEELRKNISPVALNYWMTEDKKIYTVSDVLMVSGGYWYNKDIFSQVGIKEPPKSRKEWIEACGKIELYSKKNEMNIVPILLDSNHIVYLTDAILSDEDPAMLTKGENPQVNLNRLGFRRTLMELEKIAETTQVVNSFSFRDTLAAFNSGETAMYINGSWAAPMISEKLNVGYAPLPTSDEKGVVAISSGVGYILGNTKNKEKIRASISFLNYMLSEEVAERILKETGQIPANPNVEITKELAGERLYQAVESVKEAHRIIEVPANIWGTTKKDVYGDNIILYLDKKLSMEQLQREMRK